MNGHKLLYWDKVVNVGNGWEVQETPNGADPLPKTTNGMKILDFGKNSCCFATPGEMCMKEQVVDLMGQGFTAEDLDKQPIIKISEWFASHADFIGDYLLEATLLNEKKENMKSFLFKDDFSDKQLGKWHQVIHIFSNYGTGVRYVKFSHAGQSQLNFPGHLGTKMSGGVVSLQPLIKKKNKFKYH
ncbi:hypothetical protein J437_LFUL014156 [Ladona fulva]|uniref:FBA domain-containing protein n=1 Tax=Ladona fulva TaxID=123851 RepID=A0A8K0P6S3_LADFU|nr:hypothetical protein J437_LFUL014156 [Ladona fulva]